MRRTVSLMATVGFLAALALINHGCSRTGAGTGEAIQDTFIPDINDARLKERLAEDDGYSFAVLYGADIHGSLETCG